MEFAHLTKTTLRDVWICASDGYTGYICLLSLHPRPMIYLNTPLAGCNSRITCICAVPGSPLPNIRRYVHVYFLLFLEPEYVSIDVHVYMCVCLVTILCRWKCERRMRLRFKDLVSSSFALNTQVEIFVQMLENK